jgi:hypothetical protein
VLVAKIKYVLQERPALSFSRSVMFVVVFLSAMAFLAIFLLPIAFVRVSHSLPLVKASLGGSSITQSIGTPDQDVKLPTIKPHASAFWTVVDFDSRSFSQQQINVTYGAFHGLSFFQGSGGWSHIGCKELCRSPT